MNRRPKRMRVHDASGGHWHFFLGTRIARCAESGLASCAVTQVRPGSMTPSILASQLHETGCVLRWLASGIVSFLDSVRPCCAVLRRNAGGGLCCRVAMQAFGRARGVPFGRSAPVVAADTEVSARGCLAEGPGMVPDRVGAGCPALSVARRCLLASRTSLPPVRRQVGATTCA